MPAAAAAATSAARPPRPPPHHPRPRRAGVDARSAAPRARDRGSPSAAGDEREEGGSLPFTGLQLGGMALLGAVAAGRRARRPPAAR